MIQIDCATCRMIVLSAMKLVKRGRQDTDVPVANIAYVNSLVFALFADISALNYQETYLLLWLLEIEILWHTLAFFFILSLCCRALPNLFGGAVYSFMCHHRFYIILLQFPSFCWCSLSFIF